MWKMFKVAGATVITRITTLKSGARPTESYMNLNDGYSL